MKRFIPKRRQWNISAAACCRWTTWPGCKASSINCCQITQAGVFDFVTRSGAPSPRGNLMDDSSLFDISNAGRLA